jgi:hypothetical protein
LSFRRISSCLDLELGGPYLVRDPCTSKSPRQHACPKWATALLRFWNCTEPMRTPVEPFNLAPRRACPQNASVQSPSRLAMAQRSTPPGTFNLPSPPLPPHLSSSACDEDRRARDHLQSCSSILLPTYLRTFHLHIFNPPSSILPHSSWYIEDQLSFTFAIDRRCPTSALFLQTVLFCARFQTP